MGRGSGAGADCPGARRLAPPLVSHVQVPDHGHACGARDGSELVLGRALAGRPREAVFVATKVGVRWNAVHLYQDLSAASVREECHASLRRLRMDYVDLLQIHWPHGAVPLAETLGAMQGLVEEGKVRRIGVSTGLVWRLMAGVEVGWSHRSNFDLQHFNEMSFDLKLSLPGYSVDNLVLASLVGIEWAGGDHWSLAILPRLEVLLGPEPVVALSVPLTFSWNWYL